MANLPVTGVHSVPSDLVMSAAEGDEPQVLAVNEESDLANWLLELGEPSIGALLDAGQLAGVRLLCLFLRDHDAEPFDDLELAFLSDVAGDLASAARGVEERSADKRISQALQTGMKNELQKVRGISAEGLYSSATAAAFVGGGIFCLFCDLIARSVFAPTEVTISAVTAIFGAPIVIGILMRRQKTRG